LDESLEGRFIVNERSHNVAISRGDSMLEYYDIPVSDLAPDHGIPGDLEGESFGAVADAVRRGVQR
jgi:hypothetical protein